MLAWRKEAKYAVHENCEVLSSCFDEEDRYDASFSIDISPVLVRSVRGSILFKIHRPGVIGWLWDVRPCKAQRLGHSRHHRMITEWKGYICGNGVIERCIPSN